VDGPEGRSALAEWVLWTAPLLFAALTVGGWLAWRTWLAPQAVCTYPLF
jgi:hypothetical protein